MGCNPDPIPKILPDHYPIDEAIKNGEIFAANGDIYNLQHLIQFIENDGNKRNDFIRILHYYIHFNSLDYIEMEYQGKSIQYTEYSRGMFDGRIPGIVNKGLCRGIAKDTTHINIETGNELTAESTHYYLTDCVFNEENLTFDKLTIYYVPKREYPNEFNEGGIHYTIRLEKSEYDVDVEEIGLVIENKGARLLSVPDFYKVEKFEADTWQSAAYYDDSSNYWKDPDFNDYGNYILGNGTTYKQHINMKFFSEHLTEGRYRIVKDFGHHPKLAVEFTLK